MTKTALLAIFLLGFSGFKWVYTEVKWVTLDEALEMAKQDEKGIFIDFTAEWCGWCKVMDKKTFTDASVATFMNENFHPVKLDYDSPEKLDFFGEKLTARELSEHYKVPGLPTILLLSADSKKSKKLIGYKKPDPFLKGLQQFAKK